MYSVTFRPVVIASNRRKDGTYPVRIRVTFRGVSRRLPTTLVARPGDLSRSLHIKSPDITARAGALVARMQDALADIYISKSWDHLNAANEKVLALLRWDQVQGPSGDQVGK